jgi:hypothetical protein
VSDPKTTEHPSKPASAAEAPRVTGIQISKIHRGLRKQLYSYA